MARLLYKPFGLLMGVLGGLVAGAIFRRVWAAAREAERPEPTDARKSWGEVITAAAVEGAVFGGVKAAVDRTGAEGFARLTGAWPGERDT